MKLEKTESKENNQAIKKNNDLAISQIQGSLILPQGPSITS